MFNKKKAIAVLVASIITLGIAPSQGANKAGGSCTKTGSIVKIGSFKYECEANSKYKKTVWTKIVKPAGFDCVKSKKALPTLRDSFITLEDYFETIKAVYPDTDPFYIKFKKDLDQSTSDLKTLESAVKRFC